ncbi:MAG: SWIM zinc finger family protein [Clostridia bacterium]|nr:SWIM zinc finger family protein [Clostridia bacterium]
MNIKMGSWEPGIHDNLDQIKRIESGKKLEKQVRKLDRKKRSAVIEGSSGDMYKVTLDKCTCFDFQARQMPCKHMYCLAHMNGLLDDMPEYDSHNSSFDKDAELDRYLRLYLDGQIPVNGYIGVCSALSKIK